MPETLPFGLCEALTRLARERDPAAWACIVERAGTDCWRCCLAVCGDVATAEDAFQETLMQVRDDARLFQAQGADPEAGARRWLKRVATTTALQLLRSRGRAGRRDQAAGAQAPVLTHDDPSAALDGAEELAALRTALAGLAEPRRTAIALHHLHGLPLDEVAVALNRPLGTVKTWIHRGLAELQGLLASRGVVLSIGGLLALCSSAQAASAGAALPTAASTGATALLGAGGTASVHAMALTSSGGLAMSMKLVILAVLGTSAVAVPLAFASEASEPPAVVPAAVAAEPAWLDTVLTVQDATHGNALRRIGAVLERTVVCDVEWALSGREQAQPFPLAGLTVRQAFEAFGKVSGLTWIEHEDKIVFLTPHHLARLRAEVVVAAEGKPGDQDAIIAGRQDLVEVIGALKKESGLNMIMDPQIVVNGMPQVVIPAGEHQVMDLLSNLLRQAGAHAIWQDECWFITTRPDAKILPTPCRTQFCVNGISRTAAEARIDFAFEDEPAVQAYATVARLIGVEVQVDAEIAVPVTFKVRHMKAHEALKWIAEITRSQIAEEDGRLVVRPNN